MFQHINTPRRCFAADDALTLGGPQFGPAQNAIAQGQCFADIAGGVAKSLSDNFSALAGAMVSGLAGGSLGSMLGATATGLINATIAGINAAKNSEACQQLDNAGQANELGISGMTAP